MFPSIQKSLNSKANDGKAQSESTQAFDNDDKENSFCTDGYGNKNKSHKAVIKSRYSREKLSGIDRSKYSLTEIENDVERSGGGLLGALNVPKSTECYYRTKNLNKSRIRRKGMDEMKLPPIKSLTLSNNDSNKKNNTTCPKESPQFLRHTSRLNTSVGCETYEYASETITSSTNKSFMSPGSKNESVDSYCQPFYIGQIPSKILDSPCSTISKLETPCDIKSVATPHSKFSQHTDYCESVNHDDSYTVDDTVSTCNTEEDNFSSPKSTTSSEITIFIPKNGKTRRKLDKKLTTADDSEDEEWKDEDSENSNDCSKISYVDDGSVYEKENTSMHNVVDETFFGQTIVAKAERKIFDRKKKSSIVITEDLNESCRDGYDDSDHNDSDTEIELSDDHSCEEYEMSPMAKDSNYKDQVINITTTTASLTISSEQESKIMLEKSSQRKKNLSNMGNSVSAALVLDESTICESDEDEFKDAKSPNSDKGGSSLNSVSKECCVHRTTVTMNKSNESNSRENVDDDYNPNKNKMKFNISEDCCGEDKSLKLKVSSNKASFEKFGNVKDKIKDGPLKKGKWTLGPKIGVGTFGVVHMGMNTLTGKLMAVKKLSLPSCVTSTSNKEILQDLHSEVELMRSLNHANIVRYLGAEMNKKQNIIYIFQEWIPGGSIASLLHKFGPFSTKVVYTYLKQILTGLEYLHSCRILHRDIKGGNILINDHGVVKLADFGASMRMGDCKQKAEEDFDNMTENMTVKGTPYFMAPEVYEEKCGPKADIWSVGGVVIQMITGDPPWKNMNFRSPSSLFRHLKKTEGPPPIKIPPHCNNNISGETDDEIESLQLIIKKCFYREQKSRPSASELLMDIVQTQNLDSISYCSESSNTDSFIRGFSNQIGLSPLHSRGSNSCSDSKVTACDVDKIISQIKSPQLTKKNWPDWAK